VREGLAERTKYRIIIQVPQGRLKLKDALPVVEKSSSVGHKLLSGSVLQVSSLIASALASLFIMPFVVHHLGDRLYAYWAVAGAIIGYYGMLDLGLSSAISQYISIAIGRKDHLECRAIFNTALRIQSLFGAIAILATVAIALATPLFCHNPADARLFWRVILVLGITAGIGFPARVYVGVLEAELRFDVQSWLAILGVALRTGLTVFAILGGGGLLALAWMTLLASLPVTALQIWFARSVARWARIERVGIETQRAKRFFSYSVYTFLTYLADIVRFQVDPLVISGLIGLEAVTHYRIAGVFAQYYLVMIASVGMLRPVFSRLHGADDRSGLEKAFFFGTKISLWASIFICAALIGWGKPFIARWMGMSYEDAYLPLVALSLAVFLDVCQKPSIDLLYATFKHRFYTYMNWAEGALNLVFSLALARPLGIFGVALGTLIGAFLVRVVVQPWWVCKVSGIHYGQYMRFLSGNLFRCGFLTAGAIAISAWGLRPSYPRLASSGACAVLLYLAASWFVVFSTREREYLLEAIRHRRGNHIEPATVGAAL
jgi:O-antigen/teichoic acid export membrane protein